jgi:hypothetical protein
MKLGADFVFHSYFQPLMLCCTHYHTLDVTCSFMSSVHFVSGSLIVTGCLVPAMCPCNISKHISFI